MNRHGLRAALQHTNVIAFLKAIRLGEGTKDDPRTPDVDEGYDDIVGGGHFHDFTRHPNIRVWIERYKVHSSAAGAYQIIKPTWDGLVAQYGFPDFSPAVQDEAAVALISEVKALADVKEGRFGEAVDKCSRVWASLPGSQAGQRIEDFDKIRQVYVDAGGTIA